MYVNFVLNFLSHSIFIFPLFLGIIMYANEFETKEKKLTVTATSNWDLKITKRGSELGS